MYFRGLYLIKKGHQLPVFITVLCLHTKHFSAAYKMCIRNKLEDYPRLVVNYPGTISRWQVTRNRPT